MFLQALSASPGLHGPKRRLTRTHAASGCKLNFRMVAELRSRVGREEDDPGRR